MPIFLDGLDTIQTPPGKRGDLDFPSGPIPSVEVGVVIKMA
jgi:hypothetical protein